MPHAQAADHQLDRVGKLLLHQLHALGGLGIAAALDKDVELTTLVSQGTAASTKYSILTSPD